MNTKTFSIPEWCEYRGISRGSYYNLLKAGKAPRAISVGTRKLITPEADDEWRRAREAEAAAADARVAA